MRIVIKRFNFDKSVLNLMLNLMLFLLIVIAELLTPGDG